MSYLKYKVIKILDEETLIISYGYKDGAEVGDKVRIIEVGPEIEFDKEHYGTFDAIKAKLEITTVYQDFSVCKDIERSIFNPVSDPFLKFQSTTIKAKKLDVNTEDISSEFKKPTPGKISLGDLVEVVK